jgi:NitT/TauT family transport system substrate-binding protein
MKIKSKKFLRAIMAGAAAFILVACAPSAPPTTALQPATVAPAVPAATAPTATAPAKIKLRGGTQLTSASASWAPYYSIGAYLGWLQDEGLDVEIDMVDTATALTLLAKGDYEFFIGAPEALLGVEGKGTKTGVRFAYNYYTRPWFLLAVRPDSPIKTVAELKGKTIGLSTLGVPQTPAVEIYLRDAGLKLSDVTTVAVSNQVAAAQALDSGKIDAMMQIANTFTTFENAGFKYRYFQKPKALDNLFGASYYVHDRALSIPALKDAFSRYFRVVAKSVLFAKTNPEATVRIHWKVKPESKPTGQTEEQAMASAKRELATALEYAGVKPSTGRWGELTVNQVSEYVAFMGISDAIKNPADLVTNAFIDGANSFKEDDVINFAKSYVFK